MIPLDKLRAGPRNVSLELKCLAVRGERKLGSELALSVNVPELFVNDD
jgi:hypothetical protein